MSSGSGKHAPRWPLGGFHAGADWGRGQKNWFYRLRAIPPRRHNPRITEKMLMFIARLLVCSVIAAGMVFASERTALDEYVAAPDPVYDYRLVDTLDGEGYTAFIIEMTSQKWLTTNEVDRPIWKHWMTIVRPDQLRHEIGLLFIGGGANGRPAPNRVDAKLAKLALATGSVVTELGQVPNQPLTFKGEDNPRVEDALIAYTWDKFLRTGDERWPARLPMTKSAVRALDTITSFMASEEGGGHKVDRFVVAGGSKRGWTTWSTAAVDDRVVAIVPIVIDLLNLIPSFQHHYGAYGIWAPAVHDYVEMGIMDWMNAPEFKALMEIEEPFEYRDRLTMPKFLINSAGDQFFLPDSAQFYFDQLLGVKYLRYVPNSDHSLKNTDALMSLLAFYDAILRGSPLPQFSWSVPQKGTIRVETKDKPAEVRLWQATNPEARDFRLDVLGPVCTSTVLKPVEPGLYIAKVEPPPKGWTAYFVELTFKNEPAPFKFTTQVYVTPDVLPHAEDVPDPEPPRGFLTSGSR